MIERKDVEHIAELADIGITGEEIEEFTHQFNAILEYFDILDQVPEGTEGGTVIYNVLREDEITPSLPLHEAIGNAHSCEEEFIRAPRVM
ncbi:MAG: Asp-tRNA(Asn)/Glu-tRNA(Gln) amidotransferase subunit GatC [Methanomicrobiales archaeon]|nr:Asp-tRNA(Asn)/Glu-tRNA(Gln) amidotransferase subunit GatC [Methanomicrobiales archaeon]